MSHTRAIPRGRRPSVALLTPVVTLLLALPGLHAGDDPASLRVLLRARADVAAPFVSIGDVAALEPVDGFLQRVAARVLLGLAPGPGATRRITREEIRRRLEDAGLGASIVRLAGAAGVDVSSPQRTRPPVAPPATGSNPSLPATTGGRARVIPGGRMVERDARVVIQRRRGLVQIEEPGVALTSGRIGEQVTVRSVRTGKSETARVVGKNAVEVIRPRRPLGREPATPAGGRR